MDRRQPKASIIHHKVPEGYQKVTSQAAAESCSLFSSSLCRAIVPVDVEWLCNVACHVCVVYVM